MKKYFIICGILMLNNLFSQNKKYDTILFKNVKIDNHELYFEYKKIEDLEAIYGKLNNNLKKMKTTEKIPLHYNRKVINSFSNKSVQLLINNNKAFMDYFNFELSNKQATIYYKKKKIILSKNLQLSQFKKVFQDSYKNVSGLPVIPIERASFISALIINKKSVGYISFTFYDSKLISFFISDDKPENF